MAGLYAAGEIAAGLHGASRLGGNSLAETVVFGRRAGEAAARYSASRDVALRARGGGRAADQELSGFIRHGRQFARPLRQALRDTMWETCGVVRDQPGLRHGLERLAELRRLAADVDVRPTSRATATWPTPWTCAPPWPRRGLHLAGGAGPPRGAAAPTSAATIPSSTPRCG